MRSDKSLPDEVIQVRNPYCRWLLEHVDAFVALLVFIGFAVGYQEWKQVQAENATLRAEVRKMNEAVQLTLNESETRMQLVQSLDASVKALNVALNEQNITLHGLNTALAAQQQSYEKRLNAEQALRKKQNEQIAKIQQSISKNKCAIPKSLFNGLR